MAAVSFSVTDLQRHAPGLDSAVAADLISGALGRAQRIAPCITSASFPYTAEATAIVRDAILRRVQAGTGAVTSETAGPFSVTVDTSRPWGRAFSDQEEADLRSMCAQFAGSTASGPLPAAAFPLSPLTVRSYRAALGITGYWPR